MSTVKLDYDQSDSVTKDTLLQMYSDACYADDLHILPHIEALIRYTHSRSEWVLIDAVLEKFRNEAQIEE